MSENEKKVGTVTIVAAVVGVLLLVGGCAGCLGVFLLPARMEHAPGPTVTPVPVERAEPVEPTEPEAPEPDAPVAGEDG